MSEPEVLSEPEVFETDAEGAVAVLLVVAPRVRHVWLPLAVVAAAPLLIGGGVMWRKANR